MLSLSDSAVRFSPLRRDGWEGDGWLRWADAGDDSRGARPSRPRPAPPSSQIPLGPHFLQHHASRPRCTCRQPSHLALRSRDLRFFSFRCCFPARRCMTLPLPVILNRLAAACRAAGRSERSSCVAGTLPWRAWRVPEIRGNGIGRPCMSSRTRHADFDGTGRGQAWDRANPHSATMRTLRVLSLPPLRPSAHTTTSGVMAMGLSLGELKGPGSWGALQGLNSLGAVQGCLLPCRPAHRSAGPRLPALRDAAGTNARIPCRLRVWVQGERGRAESGAACAMHRAIARCRWTPHRSGQGQPTKGCAQGRHGTPGRQVHMRNRSVNMHGLWS